MTQLLIKAADYGLEENKAKQISDMFKPMLDKMTELEVQYNEVMKRPMEPETIQMAHDLRLAYVKVRTGTADIHKKAKAQSRQTGLFIDGWKNTQLMASQGIEDKLRAIEDYFVNIENERIEKLQEQREGELKKYDVEFFPAELGSMDSSVWSNYISGVKLNYEAQKEAERKTEEERLAKIKEEEEKRQRMIKENAALKKKAVAMEKQQKIEEAKAEAERKAREEKERKEREERDLYEAELKKERDRVQAELEVKAEAERKAIEAEKERKEAELNKGDAAKVKDLVADLNTLKSKYTFKSKKSQKMYSDVSVLIDKVIKHIEQ